MAITKVHDFWPGLQAGSDLSTHQYKFVERSGTANRISVCNSAADYPIGVLYNKPDTAGQGADVAPLVAGSILKVKVAAAGVAAADYVGTDANGELVAKTAAGAFVVGQVDQAWSDNDYAEVYVNPRMIPA